MALITPVDSSLLISVKTCTKINKWLIKTEHAVRSCDMIERIDCNAMDRMKPFALRVVLMISTLAIVANGIQARCAHAIVANSNNEEKSNIAEPDSRPIFFRLVSEANEKCKKHELEKKELDLRDAESLFLKARSLAKKGRDGNGIRSLVDLQYIQNCLVKRNDWDAIIQLAAEIKESVGEYKTELEKSLYLDSLDWGGWALYKRGEIEKAIDSREEILRLGPAEPNWSLNHLILIIEQTVGIASEANKFEKADQLITKGDQLVSKMQAGEEKDRLTAEVSILLMKSISMQRRSDYLGGLKMARQAEMIIKSSKQPPMYQYLMYRIYANEGSSYEGLDKYVQALEAFQSSLKCAEKIFGSNSREVAVGYLNIASQYNEIGKYQEAISALMKANGIAVDVLGNNDPDTINIHQLMAAVKFNMRKTGIAELAAQSAEISESERIQKITKVYDPFIGQMELNKAAMLIDLGKAEEAFLIAKSGVTKISESIQTILPRLSERERVGAANSIEGDIQAIYSYMKKMNGFGKANELALFARINTHGLIQELARRQVVLNPGDKQGKQLIKELDELHQRGVNELVSPSRKEELNLKKNEFERELYSRIPALRPLLVSSEDIGKKMGSGGILIELVKYRPWDISKPRSERWSNARYLALVYSARLNTSYFDLGEAKEIDKIVDEALVSAQENLSDSTEQLNRVEALVFKPLMKIIAPYKEIYLVPDGELHRVPFAALSIFQSRLKKLRLLTTSRELVLEKSNSSSTGKPVIFANPNYNKGLSGEPHTNAGKKDNERGSISGWAILPGSLVEGRQIADTLKGELVTGDEATDTRLKAMKSPNILHLATHGFFYRAEKASSDDPMSHSGVVLAGANAGLTGNNFGSGVLTASSVSLLNLTGTELVVLSACETANGTIQSGEGVYGLQRALSIAGSHSTLLSLWKVDDNATAAFMNIFYKRLKTGEARSEALINTQSDFREGRLSKEKGWQNPYYWAAWQLTGDWRPIAGL
ncbi:MULTISPECIES: CHAT domain-containing protein [Cyanobium]|uniref:CHAT domain-containing protein n=1 Tax=Cyanobium TaxID=167375 RepID=UPI00137A9FA9|nr:MULTISPECIES: CHAT domain-containing tetratricopeptide repeat protein [Cyanobium]MCP9779425.1 CHAT domain-containing protein [Cyanobium sp. To12R1]